MYQDCSLHIWCGRQESNLHGCPYDPKSYASAYSATPATSIIVDSRFRACIVYNQKAFGDY